LKVVVTGGMGFLGTHVCKMYREMNEEVIAVDNMTKYELERTDYNADLARDHNRMYLSECGAKLVKDDICKPSLSGVLKDVDYIVNCAAQPAMTLSIENPYLDFSTNVIGLLNLLEIARKKDIPIAHCSTIHVYGNGINRSLIAVDKRYRHTRKKGFGEDEPLLTGSLSPLHASKRTGEIYCQTYIDTYGLKAICLRLSGMYGANQFGGEDHGWVANFAIKTLMDRPISIFGTEKQVRDILFVGDAIRIFSLFFKHQRPGIYNAGGGVDTAISLRECIDKLSVISGKKSDLNYFDKRYGDLWWFVSDNSKLHDAIGWSPSVSPDRGLPLLLDWIKENKVIFDGKE